MATNYSRGAEFERRIVNFFRNLGYFAVRTPASKTAVDVIAWNATEFRMIQAKMGYLSPKELEVAKEALRGVQAPPSFYATEESDPEPLYREVWVKRDARAGGFFAVRHEVERLDG